ncbi:hypothetical protein [Sphingobacterium thermophilum]|uniref:hypothetical protein n=1 Tax=Sphingobacterium thermophilum TaxID=768534 RepID=UPI0031F0DD40
MKLKSKDPWTILSPFFKQVEAPARTILLQEGKISKTMYFIEKGCLRTWASLPFP